MKIDCQLSRPPFYQCCCVCESSIAIVDDEGIKTGKYICIIHPTLDVEDRVAEEIPEHCGGCELWTDIRRKGV